MPKRIDVQRLQQTYLDLLNERQDFEPEWRSISEYILPGRGINYTYKNSRKRRLTTTKVVNPTAKDSLRVLSAMLQGGLTSAARNWFQLEFTEEKPDALNQWLFQAYRTLVKHFASSNLYSSINIFYTEYGGFGTSSMMMLEDPDTIFRFEPMTVGEYAISLNSKNRLNKFFRVLYLTASKMAEKFPKSNLPTAVKEQLDKKTGSTPDGEPYYPVIHCIYPESYIDKPHTSVYFMFEASDQVNTISEPREPLLVGGYYEMPALVGRWDVIGTDTYGLGPGHESLPNVKRLQEMEKSFLQGTHKMIDPPVNVPAKMRGKQDLLPGGVNYYSDPNLTIKTAYDVQLDFAGVSAAIERVENRIEKNFYNDLLLTGQRDPNASPLRTGQVNEQSDERMVQLGPVIQRLQNEVLESMIERGFNMLARAGLMPELPPQLVQQLGSYEIRMISPLAQAQKLLEARSIQSFMGFVGAAAQLNPEALDRLDMDNVIDEYGDISGAPPTIIRSVEDAKVIRDARLQAQQEQQAKQDQLLAESAQNETLEKRATAAEKFSNAGVNLNDQGFSVQ